MTSDYVIASIKLCQVGNHKYIIVCSFSGRRMSGFEIIEGRRPRPPRCQEAKKQTNKQTVKEKIKNKVRCE